MKHFLTVISGLALSISALAAPNNPPQLASVPAPPTIPSVVKSGEVLEPDIRIIHSPTRTVHEYRTRGRIYMVKITPSNGFPPYYIMDSDGDGYLDMRTNYHNAFQVPQWRLYSW
jgi:hypothetical protein